MTGGAVSLVRIPVVRREDPRSLVGYLGRANVMSARLSWYRSEHTRHRGWVEEPPPDRIGA